MPLECEDFPKSGRVPDFHRLVLACAGEAFAVGAEVHTYDGACVPPEGLCAVEASPEMAMLPAAQVPLAILKKLQCLRHVEFAQSLV